MKYLFLLIPFLLISCGQIQEKSSHPTDFRFSVVEPNDFGYDSYNSGAILSIAILERLNNEYNEYVNMETMNKIKEPQYIPVDGCKDFHICLRYEIRVQYPNGELKTEYVMEVHEFNGNHWYTKLIDDSVFYKNK